MTKNCGCFVERVDSDADAREANTDLPSHLWQRILLNPFHVPRVGSHYFPLHEHYGFRCLHPGIRIKDMEKTDFAHKLSPFRKRWKREDPHCTPKARYKGFYCGKVK